MRRNIARLLVLVVVFCAITTFVPLSALWLWVSPLPPTVNSQVQKMDKHFSGGVVVFVDKKGQAPVYYVARGSREGEVDSNALFKIASISKLYMAAATAKLIAQGKLQADKTLATYLPEVKDSVSNASSITLRMLVQHRTGIPDFIDSPQMPWANLPVDLDAYLRLVYNTSADFSPDTRYSYSNTNYLLLGKLLDRALGYSHHEYIKSEFLSPLGLAHTYGSPSEVDVESVSSGYFEGYEGDLKAQHYSVPGGSMLATAQDVGIFLRALNTGGILNKEEQEVYSKLYPNHHTGLLPGYSSIAKYHEDVDAVVVLFVCSSGGDTWTEVEVLYDRIVKIIRK
jgi:D-alanyl-D-alanine carboxypeptidase